MQVYFLTAYIPIMAKKSRFKAEEPLSFPRGDKENRGKRGTEDKRLSRKALHRISLLLTNPMKMDLTKSPPFVNICKREYPCR